MSLYRIHVIYYYGSQTLIPGYCGWNIRRDGCDSFSSHRLCNPMMLRWGFIIPNKSIYYCGSQTLIPGYSGWNIRRDGGAVGGEVNRD